ncbi:hypothetical protein G6L91_31740 [Agrobacterium rhizogenes]|nr:hypothetical protein [Rhizobium rhizogenes]NTF66066.1 hypothetical protein [Rhizobium rhizogenes]NTG12076.1 hypothetical protein [Rhizobium rhizogenes]
MRPATSSTIFPAALNEFILIGFDDQHCTAAYTNRKSQITQLQGELDSA